MGGLIQFVLCTSPWGKQSFLLISCFHRLQKKSDVLCIEMLDQIVQQYATSHVFTSRLMLHWRTALESKYLSVSGISDMHDILLSKKAGKLLLASVMFALRTIIQYCIITNTIHTRSFLISSPMSQSLYQLKNYVN